MIHLLLTSTSPLNDEICQLAGTHDVSDMAKAKFYMPPVCFIVARSSFGHVIGCEGELPWVLRSDLARFRTLTLKHAVIMGRKTYDSIGKPLPNRLNIVISRSEIDSMESVDLHGTETKLMHSKSVEDALFCSDLFTILNDSKKIFVIGGAEVYRRFSSKVDRVYLTEVHADVRGDAYFTQEFPETEWRLASQELVNKSERDQFDYTFSVFDRKTSSKRLRTFSEISNKHQDGRLCMKALTDHDAKLIEGYARQHFKAEGQEQIDFRF